MQSKPSSDAFIGPNILIYCIDNSSEKGYYLSKCSYIISRWKEATGIVTSSVAYAEALASIYRKKKKLSSTEVYLKKSFIGKNNGFKWERRHARP